MTSYLKDQPYTTRNQLYISGAWTPSISTERIVVDNPFTEEPIGEVPACGSADVDRAVAAANAALPGWSGLSVKERCALLERVAMGLEARRDEIAVLIAREVGTPVRYAYPVQADLPVSDLRSTVAAAPEVAFEEVIGNSLVLQEPVGVVAAITPWNFPLHQLVAKVAGALAAGCAIVAKPSELAPLSGFLLMEVCDEAGIPPGVVNLVTGFGQVVGEALASHADVDMVSFTGSTVAGRRVATLACESVKRVALELGGKSAAIVLDDANLGAAVRGCMSSCYLNAGQTCNAHTRLLVPEARLYEAEALAEEQAKRFTCGDPLEPETRLGPLVSAVQRERVREHVTSAVADGARLITGGAEPPAERSRGFFVSATVLSSVTPGMRIAREEVFGPVLCVIGYRDEAEAVRIANETPYGLSSGVWSSDDARAEALARSLRAGQIDINGAAFNPAAPFGGVRASGYGRELGRFGIEEFLSPKAIQR